MCVIVCHAIDLSKCHTRLCGKRKCNFTNFLASAPRISHWSASIAGRLIPVERTSSICRTEMGGNQGWSARFGEREKSFVLAGIRPSDRQSINLWSILRLATLSYLPHAEFTCLSNCPDGDAVEPCTMVSAINLTIAKSSISILVFLDASLCSRIERSRKSEGIGIAEV